MKFITRQFKSGNSQAIRIPKNIAFSSKTELSIYREGDKIIIEPIHESLEKLPDLFLKLNDYHNGKRPEFIDEVRDWSGELERRTEEEQKKNRRRVEND